jgi:hypothetical protein
LRGPNHIDRIQVRKQSLHVLAIGVPPGLAQRQGPARTTFGRGREGGGLIGVDPARDQYGAHLRLVEWLEEDALTARTHRWQQRARRGGDEHNERLAGRFLERLEQCVLRREGEAVGVVDDRQLARCGDACSWAKRFNSRARSMPISFLRVSFPLRSGAPIASRSGCDRPRSVGNRDTRRRAVPRYPQRYTRGARRDGVRAMPCRCPAAQ